MIGNGVHSDSRETKSSGSVDGSTKESDPVKSGYEPPRPLDGLFDQVRELVGHANLYFEARKDMMRATVRGLIVKAVLGIVAAIAGLTLIIVAVVQLLSGAARGLGVLFGERYWLGELVVAAAVFGVVVLGAFVGIRVLAKGARERTIKKYERRQQSQRQRFGRSTAQRAQQLRQSHRG